MYADSLKAFIKEFQVFMTQGNKAFENIVGTGEIDGKQHIIFSFSHIVFYPY